MNKSIYSLVLLDDVVSEIDRLAFESGTSRSNMINQILADYVSYTTPQRKMRDIFETMERNLFYGNSVFESLLQPSESMLSLRSSLSYKYNPTVKYSLELDEKGFPYIGELRVSFRSQNSSFKLYMMQFFKLWQKVEENCLGKVDSVIADDRFIRRIFLRHPEAADYNAIGDGISEYIKTMDSAMKLFFRYLEQPQKAVYLVEDVYREYAKTDTEIV